MNAASAGVPIVRQHQSTAELCFRKRRRQLIQVLGEHARRPRPSLTGACEHVQAICLSRFGLGFGTLLIRCFPKEFHRVGKGLIRNHRPYRFSPQQEIHRIGRQPRLCLSRGGPQRESAVEALPVQH